MGRAAARMSALSAETIGTWAELNERVSQDLRQMSSRAIEETARASTELQQTTFAAWRDAQTAVFAWQTLWPEFFRDPVRWYQRAFEQAMGSVDATIELHRRSAEIATRSFERLKSQSEEAARTLDDTFRHGAAKIREIQNRTEPTRAA